MFENPIIKKNQYISRFNQLYKGTDFQGYGNINLMNKYLEKITSVNTMITHLLNTKTQIAENINITEVEKNSSISIIELTISFLNNNNIDHYISELNILRTNIETLKTNESLISPNQEMVKTLSLIGVAQYSTEYWLEQSDDLYDDTPDEPQPVAPWVAADVVGGVVGVYGNILVDVATGQNSSWTSYGVSFLWGAATTSLGGWFKW